MKKTICMLLVVIMMAGMLIGVVSADEAKQAVVLLPGRTGDGSYTNVHVELNEGETKYLLTTDDGYATYTGASASNYNIKFEYATGGTPTLYLKNAYLENSQYMCIAFGRSKYGQLPDILKFDVVLVVEADSTILAKTRDPENSLVGYTGITFGNKGMSTLTGPGKLKVTAESNAAISCSGEFLIKDLDLTAHSLMPTSWGTRNCIFCYNGNLTIDNCVMDLYAKTGPCIWNSEAQWEKVGDKYDITIKNGTKIKAVADIYSTENAMIGAMGKIYVDSSDIELISTGAASGQGIRCFSPKPTLTNVTAIGGKTQEKAAEFNPSKSATTYYFKCTATTGGGDVGDPTTDGVADPTTNVNVPTIDNIDGDNKPAESKPADETTPKGDDTNEEKNGSNVVVTIVIAAVAVAVIAAGVFFFLKKKKAS